MFIYCCLFIYSQTRIESNGMESFGFLLFFYHLQLGNVGNAAAWESLITYSALE